MFILLFVLYIFLFFTFGAIAKKNTGTTPSFDELGKVTLQVTLLIAIVVGFIYINLFG